MNNPFEKSYIEVTIPLADEMLKALNNSRYRYLLEDFKRECKNPLNEDVWCEMQVGFDIANGEKHFNFITVYNDFNEPSQSVTLLDVDFSPYVAEYFKQKALQHLARNFSAMNACQSEAVRVTA